MTTTLTAVETFPPKCLRPGIWRHYTPDIEDVDLNGEEGVEHVISTSDAGPVVGKLIRWVWNDGEVGYEARIDGVEDSGGVSDIAAFSTDMIGAIACVANDLRYEWEILTGVAGDRELDLLVFVEVAESGVPRCLGGLKR
jgi:hypothetical protein